MLVKDFVKYSDSELIERITAGETKLYEIIVRRYNPFLFKIGRSYGFDYETTQDLMQDCFVSAYYGLPKFENRSLFKTWIIRIMLNLCYQKKQKPSYQNEVNMEISQLNNSPLFNREVSTEKNVLNRELGHVIENALGEIPEDYRMIFTLRELNGLSVAETAESLNISQSNVKVRLSRAKSMLRSHIEKIYAPDDIYEFNLIYCDSIVDRVMNIIFKNKN